MSTNTITDKIAEYISEQKISVNQVAKDTQIAKEKLQVPPKAGLNAEELLSLCNYLHIMPEKFE